jgi:hypothetical protein
MWKINLCIKKNCLVSTSNILARKSAESPMSYCKIGAKSEGYNWPGPLVMETRSEDGRRMELAQDHVQRQALVLAV